MDKMDEIFLWIYWEQLLMAASLYNSVTGQQIKFVVDGMSANVPFLMHYPLKRKCQKGKTGHHNFFSQPKCLA